MDFSFCWRAGSTGWPAHLRTVY